MAEPEAKRPKVNGNGHIDSAIGSSGKSNGHIPKINGVSTTTANGSHHKLQHLYTHRYTVQLPPGELANAVKVSPNKEKLAVCSSSQLIRIYDIKTGALLSTLKGHTKGVSDIAFLPIDNNILALCSDDLTIRIWSIAKSKCIRILKKHTYHITTLKFNSKGNLLISGAADETIVVWDLTTGRSLKTLAAHSDPVSSVCLTPDDTIIVSGSYDGLMRLFDLATGQCLKTLVYNSSTHGTATASTNDVVNFPISHVQISPNGRYILSLSLDGKIRLWDYMNNKVVKTYAGFTDGLANGSVDGSDGDMVNTKYDSGSQFITATTRPLVVSGSDYQGVLFWDVQSKEIVFQLQKGDTVLDVAAMDEGQTLVVSTLLGSVNVYELSKEYERKEDEEGKKNARESLQGVQSTDQTPAQSVSP